MSKQYVKEGEQHAKTVASLEQKLVAARANSEFTNAMMKEDFSEFTKHLKDPEIAKAYTERTPMDAIMSKDPNVLQTALRSTLVAASKQMAMLRGRQAPPDTGGANKRDADAMQTNDAAQGVVLDDATRAAIKRMVAASAANLPSPGGAAASAAATSTPAPLTVDERRAAAGLKLMTSFGNLPPMLS